MLAVRLAPIKQHDNLAPEKAAKMETTTTTKDAYQGLQSKPAAPIKPRQANFGQVEPFRGSTENRDAFTPKALGQVHTYRLKDNNIMSGAFEGHSRYKDDFVDRGVTKTKSFAPSHEYKRPSVSFSTETTNRADFISHQGSRSLPFIKQKTLDHWNETQTVPDIGVAQSSYKLDFPSEQRPGERVSFKPPISTMKLGRETVDISTNYKDDFTFKGAAKPKSYAPVTTFIQPGVKMESSTEAHDQYTGQFLPPPRSLKPKYELDPNRPRFDGLSTYGDSFKKFRFLSEVESNAIMADATPTKSLMSKK